MKLNSSPLSCALFVFACLLMLPVAGNASGPGDPVDTIWLGNPSFEDIPRAGGFTNMRPIRGWIDCGLSQFPEETPPDIHPVRTAAWGVTKPARDGETYLGMVVRDDESWESVSQAMSASLEPGQCYAFSVWMCRSESYFSARTDRGDSLYPFTQPAVLRIFGGDGFCDESELLAESAPVNGFQWSQFTFKFEPARKHRYITFQAFYKTPVLVPYNGHVLLDGMSPIIPIPCSTEDIAEIFEPVEDVVPVNSSPPEPATPKVNTSPPKPKPPSPPVAQENDAKAKKLLTELDREKLHQGKTIRIERLYFKADSANMDKESFPVLDEIADFLKTNPDVVIEIGGHTNTIPGPEYCNTLSTARAKSVTEYLIDRGVAKGQLQYKGYGKTKPIVPNDIYSSTAQAKNQRVEIKVLSLRG